MGYLVSSWWMFTILWFPILMSRVVKGLLLRYGGRVPMGELSPSFSV